MTRINSIILQSGGLFDFDNPETSSFTIEDIAHNLSHICRFNGGCDRFYSVAQHSIGVSRLVPKDQRRAAILHDGGEAFYGDMTTWLKAKCPDYRRELARGEAAVAAMFGVPADMSPEIKRADYIMLAVERRALFQTTKLERGNDGFHNILDISEEEILAAQTIVDTSPWTPRMAKREFLLEWEEINAA